MRKAFGFRARPRWRNQARFAFDGGGKGAADSWRGSCSGNVAFSPGGVRSTDTGASLGDRTAGDKSVEFAIKGRRDVIGGRAHARAPEPWKVSVATATEPELVQRWPVRAQVPFWFRLLDMTDPARKNRNAWKGTSRSSRSDGREMALQRDRVPPHPTVLLLLRQLPGRQLRSPERHRDKKTIRA
jgi:hypothetical protein